MPLDAVLAELARRGHRSTSLVLKQDNGVPQQQSGVPQRTWVFGGLPYLGIGHNRTSSRSFTRRGFLWWGRSASVRNCRQPLLQVEVILPYLTDIFGSTPDEAVETFREWARSTRKHAGLEDARFQPIPTRGPFRDGTLECFVCAEVPLGITGMR
jgi:hypothetical protein